MAALALLTALAAVWLSGCSLFRPAPPPLGRAEVIRRLRARSERFRTLVDTDISLSMTTGIGTDPERSPSLGGHIAFDRRLPGLWLNTEKLGQKVFSLKALDMRFSLLLPETGELVTGGPRAYAKLPFLVRPDEVQAMFAGPDSLGLTEPDARMEPTDDRYVFHVDLMGVPYRRVTVAAGTADLLSIERYDVRGRLITHVELGQYGPADGNQFPYRLAVERPLAGVRVELELDDPKLNKDIPLAAFALHDRTDFKHINLDYQPLSDVKAFRGEE
ncbi:MAG: hypothetical protein ACOC7T_03825 [Planctomycetota bacterium]